MHVATESSCSIYYLNNFIEEYCRQSFDPSASGLASLQWDSAKLFQIGIHDHMSYDDAFTIEEVAIINFGN